MRNKPRIRFKGFTEDWEQRKLSDITEIVMGQSPSSKNYTDNPNDNILVQGNADLKDGKVVPRLWTKEITKTIDKDGIILTVRAPVGDVARTDYKVVLGRGVAGIKGNDYIYQFLQKLQNNRYWVSLSSGSTFESINSNDIKDLIIDIPSVEEQTKISMLLNNVNSIITLHQRKLEKLKLAKKALLQKLFPKNGSQFPEIRFKGFTDAWEQRKLRNLLEQPITDGPHETPELYNSGIPFISVDAIVDNKIDFTKMRGYISKEYDDICAKKYKPQINDVYLVKSGATIGKVAIVDTYDDFNIWSPLAAMRCGSITNPYFLYILLQTQDLQSQVFNKASHGTQPNLSMRQLEQFTCKVPKIEEQKLISRFLKQLDDVITLHQRKLDKLQDMKKGLLQKMFV